MRNRGHVHLKHLKPVGFDKPCIARNYVSGRNIYDVPAYKLLLLDHVQPPLAQNLDIRQGICSKPLDYPL